MLLEQNYRSTQNILSAANGVISHNFDRKVKNLFTTVGDGEKIVGFTGYTQHDEAQFIADEIATLREGGLEYKDIAVFYRTNAQTRALEEIFIRSALPYRVLGGTKFYERAEIKDAMAYLIAVANPFDPIALRRVMNTPKRGIGPATEAALQAHADKTGKTPARCDAGGRPARARPEGDRRDPRPVRAPGRGGAEGRPGDERRAADPGGRHPHRPAREDGIPRGAAGEPRRAG